MYKFNQALGKNKDKHEHLHWIVDFLLAIVLAFISMLTFKDDFTELLESLLPKAVAIAVGCKVSSIVSLIVWSLYFIKAYIYGKGIKTQREYLREQKINQVNQAVFAALYKANSSKIRETFRYTYGTVPKWNPIDYRTNVLVYDVHEQIRSILTSLKDCVIDIDPERFNDNNVSVELVYCYPEDKNDKGKRSEDVWKLISSGDTSGNERTVSSYLNENDSFYFLTSRLGAVFKNDKIAGIEDYQKNFLAIKKENQNNDKTAKNPVYQNELLSEETQSDDGTAKEQNQPYYIVDIRDYEHSKDGHQYGSVIGTVINIKNDCPEAALVKAILTINTYGEKMFVGVPSKCVWRKQLQIDKFGFTEGDYKYIFNDIILSAFGKLLETELAQMYIRHSIKDGKKCPRTGQPGCVGKNGKSEIHCGCSLCKCETKKKTDASKK